MVSLFMLVGFFLMSCIAAAGLIASAQNQADADNLLDQLQVHID